MQLMPPPNHARQAAAVLTSMLGREDRPLDERRIRQLADVGIKTPAGRTLRIDGSRVPIEVALESFVAEARLLGIDSLI